MTHVEFGSYAMRPDEVIEQTKKEYDELDKLYNDPPDAEEKRRRAFENVEFFSDYHNVYTTPISL